MINNQSQNNFPWIKDKFIRNVVDWDGSFYLITSKDYDRDVDILNSENKKFNAFFDRKSEPGLFSVFDSIVVKDKSGEKNLMKTLMKFGDYLYLDTIDLDLCTEPDCDHIHSDDDNSHDHEHDHDVTPGDHSEEHSL